MLPGAWLGKWIWYYEWKKSLAVLCFLQFWQTVITSESRHSSIRSFTGKRCWGIKILIHFIDNLLCSLLTLNKKEPCSPMIYFLLHVASWHVYSFVNIDFQGLQGEYCCNKGVSGRVQATKHLFCWRQWQEFPKSCHHTGKF